MLLEELPVFRLSAYRHLKATTLVEVSMDSK